MTRNRSLFKDSARSSLTQGGIVFASFFALTLVRPSINYLFDRRWVFNWQLALVLSTCFAALAVIGTFISTFTGLRRLQGLESPDDTDVDPLQPRPSAAFLCMEYHTGIFNRSFVVFVAPEGLFGWKFTDTVDTSNPSFYSPYEGFISDPSSRPSLRRLRELAGHNGNFFIARSEIASIDYDPSQKWGMGPIVHSGRLNVRLASGKKREFVLLGGVDGDAIRDKAAVG